MNRTRNPLIAFGLVTLLAGCAAAPHQENGAFRDLRGRAPEALFATDLPVESAEEAIALGDEQVAANKVDHALYYYVRALEFDDRNPETFYRIGVLQMGKGDVPRAEAAFRLAMDRNIEHAGAAEGLGLIMLRRRDYGEAQALLESAVIHDAGRWQAEGGLAALADLAGDHARAARYYQSALAKNPGSARLQNNFGYSRYLAGDWEGAESHYREAIQIDPKFRLAWQNLAQIKVRRGDLNGAMETFGQVLSKAEAENNVGYLCMVGGDYPTAEAWFRRAVKDAPSYYPTAERNLEQVQRLHADRRNGSAGAVKTVAP